MGFTTLGKLAHQLENVLNLMRNGELATISAIVDTLLKAADRLRWMIDNVECSNDTDIDDHLAALEQIITGLIESEGSRRKPAAGRCRKRHGVAGCGSSRGNALAATGCDGQRHTASCPRTAGRNCATEAKPPAAVPAAVPVAVPAAHVANPVADTIRVGGAYWIN